MPNNKPIGFMDSGVGGISVLREAIKMLPNENFIYLGDSANAPYGTKSDKEILVLTIKAVESLIQQNAKAIVIACNTATSVAINHLRLIYPTTPIIGIEPAVKPAASLHEHGKILVLATPATLKRDKFINLVLEHTDTERVIAKPCPGLVELIESGHLEDEYLEKYLQDNISDYLNMDISVIVLGCTHYPFIKNKLSHFFGNNVDIIDGSNGTSKQLLNKLKEFDLVNSATEKGTVVLTNSSENPYLQELSLKLLNL